MNKFEIYSSLTTSEKNNGQNLLESTRYYKNGLKLVSIISKIDSQKVDFKVTYGYHGTLFNKPNKFKTCKILIQDINDKDKVVNILNEYKDNIDFEYDNGKFTIKLK